MIALGAAVCGLYYMGIVDDSLVGVVAGIWQKIVDAVRNVIGR